MDWAASHLAGVLEKQAENYRNLKELLFEQRKAITENNLQKLSAATSKIQLLITENNRLEMGRIDMVKKMAAELKLTGANPTLRQIASHLGGPDSDRLLELHRQAASTISEVKRENSINEELLRYGTDLMDSVWKAMVDPEPHDGTYGSTGQANKAASITLLDRQA